MSRSATYQGIPGLVLVESRRTGLTEAALSRIDTKTALVRFHGVSTGLPSRSAPTFWVDPAQDLKMEADRFQDWAEAQNISPQYFCNQHEVLQGVSNRFAGLLGLPHLTDRQVRESRSKLAMKRLYAKAGLASARYAEVRSAADILRFAEQADWPLILKPDDGDGCRGTRKISDPDDMDLTTIFHGHDRWLVEEYVRGTEYQICSIIFHSEPYLTFVSLNPAPVLDSLSGAINANITLAAGEPSPFPARDVARRLAQALGLWNGHVHAEAFVTSDGTLIMGETASRIGGSELLSNHSLAYGFNMQDAALSAYLDEQPQIEFTNARSVGDLILPLPRGTITEISTNDEIARIEGVINSCIHVQVGQKFEPERASFSNAGFVQVAGKNSGEVHSRMERVLAEFAISAQE